MAHITDLHLNILRNVLACFYHGAIKRYNLQEFRQLLPPAAVCRVWRECVLPYVYHTAYLEYRIKETDENKETEQPEFVWESNINLIVSQHLSSVIKRLWIRWFWCSPKCSDMIHALDTFGFSSSHWRAVNVLRIHITIGDDVDYVLPSSSDSEALAGQLTDYFGQHLPNIGYLFIDSSDEGNATQLLSNKLVNLYISQLYSLVCHPDPITFNCHSFSSRLRRLAVGIAPGVTNRLPQLLASPLEKLELFDIPPNFAWWTFIGTTPGHIEFTNLTYLNLKFYQPPKNTEKANDSNGQVSTSTVSLNIGCRKLFFPKLKKLHIYDSPYYDGTLYSLFVHSPLQTVNIWSSFKSVQHMDPRIMFNGADVRLHIESVSPDEYNDYVKFYCKLLGTPSNAKTAWLGVNQSNVPLPIPNTIGWVNLEYLDLLSEIHLASVILIVTQLPKLLTLQTGEVLDEVNETGTNLQALLEGRLTQIPTVATSVKRLSIYTFSFQPLEFSLDVVRYLTTLVHSLDEIVVPTSYVSDIKEFAAYHADTFPHLCNIRVCPTACSVAGITGSA